jgi:hypothetical protein
MRAAARLHHLQRLQEFADELGGMPHTFAVGVVIVNRRADACADTSAAHRISKLARAPMYVA